MNEREAVRRILGARDVAGYNARTLLDMLHVYAGDPPPNQPDPLTTLLASCGSPMERILFSAFVVYGGHWLWRFSFTSRRSRVIWNGRIWSDVQTTCQLQAPLGRYRADFLLTKRLRAEAPAASVVVEVDGHEYHERTKQQAARDRERDRALQASGHSVLRFTGSQVWEDPGRCAVEAGRFVTQRAAYLLSVANGDR